MAAFSFERTFDLVIIPAATFLYNVDFEDQLATMTNVDDVLAADGTLALSYYRPAVSAMCDWYGSEQSRTIELDGDEHTLYSTVSFADEVERIIRMKADTGELVAEATLRAALVPKREMELLLCHSGFANYEVYGDFDREPVSDERAHLVWVAER